MKNKCLNALKKLRNIVFVSSLLMVLIAVVFGAVMTNAEIQTLGKNAIYVFLFGALIEAIRFCFTNVKISIQIKGL